MSLFGIPFFSTKENPPLIKKNDEDPLFAGADADEKAPKETKDEQNVDRSPLEEQENRAPADDHYSSLPGEEEAPVEKEELIVDATPAQLQAMNQTSASPRAPLECDYDADPTKLYESLQARNWDNSIKRCKNHDKEARTWVSRKEKNGKLRWRLLPLHAAVIFKAPDSVIEALLAAYPRGAEYKDDQGMLPLHLAFRNGSSEGVVNLLLAAFPKSIEVKDRKGRIPLVLAQASTSPNRDAFMRALERGPSYYAAAAAATERAAVTAEQQAMFDAKLREKEEAYQEEMLMLRVDAEQRQMDYVDKINQLEQDLNKTQETSKVLVDHVNTLEAQLNSRTDTERFLATRIAALDVDLKETARGKEDLETTLQVENEDLKAEKLMLEDEVKALKEENAAQAEKLHSVETQLAKTQGDFEIEHKEVQAHLISLQKEWASAKASEAVLEAQLKKRIKSEKGLAGEVSFLASRLAESAHDSGQSVGNYSNRVRTLEQERDQLRMTVKALTDKLSNVAKALDDMMLGQNKIVEAASRHEQNMEEAAEIHSKLIGHARRHQDLFEAAQEEREELARTIQRQEEEAAKQSEERKAILEAFELQEEQMRDSTEERKQLVERVEQQRLGIQDLIVTNLSGIAPALNTKEDEVVDEMVKLVMSTDTTENATIPVIEDTKKEKVACTLEEALKRIEKRTETQEQNVEEVNATPTDEKVFNFEGISKGAQEDEVQNIRDAP